VGRGEEAGCKAEGQHDPAAGQGIQRDGPMRLRGTGRAAVVLTLLGWRAAASPGGPPGDRRRRRRARSPLRCGATSKKRAGTRGRRPRRRSQPALSRSGPAPECAPRCGSPIRPGRWPSGRSRTVIHAQVKEADPGRDSGWEPPPSSAKLGTRGTGRTAMQVTGPSSGWSR
jgi:hypothetical protein